MYSLHGTQQIYVYSDKRIIKSGAIGETTVKEVRWLADKMVEYAKPWKETGWGYLVDIAEMTPVSPEVSQELIELHKKIEEAGCKAIAFVDSGAFMIAVQAQKHQMKSKVSYKEKHFKTEKDAMIWLRKILDE